MKILHNHHVPEIFSFLAYNVLLFLLQTSEELPDNTVGESDQARSCVLEKYVGHILRQNLRNLVEGICPERKFSRKLYASQFQVCLPHDILVLCMYYLSCLPFSRSFDNIFFSSFSYQIVLTITSSE